jgi:hypothetical protein
MEKPGTNMRELIKNGNFVIFTNYHQIKNAKKLQIFAIYHFKTVVITDSKTT